MTPPSGRSRTIADKFNLTNPFSDRAGSDPVGQMAAEVLDAALVCAAHFESLVRENTLAAKEATDKCSNLRAEFAAAFTYLALDFMLIREHREMLRAKLLFLFPEAVRDKFVEREPDYANSSRLFVPDKPFSGDGLVNKLALHVAETCDSPFNPELVRQCVSIFANVSVELGLRDLALACV